MSRFLAMLRRATMADIFVLASVIALGWALLRPTLGARAFQQRVAAAIADVDTVSAQARRVLAASDRWPTSAPPGESPPELLAFGETPPQFIRADYTLGWQTWLVVDSIEAPPEPLPPPSPGDPPRRPPSPIMVPVNRALGSVRVHGEDALLAELLRHYGAGSFVLDSAWVLVLPERAEAPTP